MLTLYILILSSPARLDFPNYPFPLGFPRKPLCISVLLHILFCNMLTLLSWRGFSPSYTLKTQDHPLSIVSHFFFNILAGILCNW